MSDNAKVYPNFSDPASMQINRRFYLFSGGEIFWADLSKFTFWLTE